MKSLLTLLACATLARADSPPEWLELPGADVARPTGVSTWILENFQKVTQENEGVVRTLYRFAEMPLSEAGTKHAAFGVPYVAGFSSVVSARAWTFSGDGKKCREFGGSDFVVASPVVNDLTWDQSKAISFNPQKYLQPGWIVAYEIEIKSDSNAFDFHWGPRCPWPVRKATLQMVPLVGGAVKWRDFSADLPAPRPMGSQGAMEWSMADIPGFGQDVPASLERNTVQLRTYLLANPAEHKSWADVAHLARNEMEPKAVMTPLLAAQAKSLAGGGDLWTRILPVCRFVQKDVSYLGVTIDSDSLAGYRPHPAAEVCGNRYGDCKDKAVLLCTFLRSMGVESYVTLLCSGLPTANRMDWPSANFNHAIVAIACTEAPPEGAPVVHSGGKDYLLFDPTNEFVPFGLLPNGDRGGIALVLAPESDSAVVIPEPEFAAPTLERDITISLAPDGTAQINFSENRFGPSAADAITSDATEPLLLRTGALELRIEKRMPLVSNLVWTSASADDNRHWSREVHFSAQYVGRRIAGAMYVPTDLMSVVPGAEPWEDREAGWVPVQPGFAKRTIRIVVPAGWEIAALPEDWSSTSSAGESSVHYVKDNGNVRGEMVLRIGGGVLDRDAYLDYRTLLHSALVAEHRPVMLRKAPAAAPAAATRPVASD